MKKVQTTTPTQQEIEKLKKKQRDSELRKQLAISPDLLITRKSSDKELDKRIERNIIINGKLRDVNKILDYIDGKIADYARKFKPDYYKEIFRLNGWAIPASGKISKKPNIVGRFTRDIIYGRFPKEVIETLEERNKFMEEYGVRMFKHFQLLTPEKSKQVESFIDDSVDVMRKCQNWQEFVNEHGKKFGFPYQTSLF